MSAEDDAVANLDRLEVMFRGILALVPKLREAGSLHALADQAQQRLTATKKEFDTSKASLDDTRAQAQRVVEDAKRARSEADNYRAKAKAECDEMRAKAQADATRIEADASAKASQYEADAQAAAKQLAADTEASLSDTNVKIKEATAKFSELTSEIADKQAALDQINALLRSKI